MPSPPGEQHGMTNLWEKTGELSRKRNEIKQKVIKKLKATNTDGIREAGDHFCSTNKITATAETHKYEFKSLTTGVGSLLTLPLQFKEEKKADIIHPFLFFSQEKPSSDYTTVLDSVHISNVSLLQGFEKGPCARVRKAVRKVSLFFREVNWFKSSLFDS